MALVVQELKEYWFQKVCGCVHRCLDGFSVVRLLPFGGKKHPVAFNSRLPLFVFLWISNGLWSSSRCGLGGSTNNGGCTFDGLLGFWFL